MSTRLHIVVSDELVARVDGALGPGQPRADFIRRAVEQALGVEMGDAVSPKAHVRSQEVAPPAPASAEQPEPIPDEEFLSQLAKPDWKTAVSAPFGTRSSVQAKRDVRPIPKKGEKS